MLTPTEQDVLARAEHLLERTAYDGEAPERVTDARAVAHGTIEMARALEAERSGRKAIQAERDRLRAITARAAYQATARP